MAKRKKGAGKLTRATAIGGGGGPKRGYVALWGEK